MMAALAYLYYIGLPLGFTWCVLSYLKTGPGRPGYLRKYILDRIPDRRPWRVKCKRFRTDGPTPCWCCRGRCYAAKDGEA